MPSTPSVLLRPRLYILASSRAVCRLLGYCPQTDPLLDLMTVRETLLFFGGLKGVGSDVAELASLEEAHDRRAGSWWRRASSRLASVRRSILEHKRVSLEDAVAKAMSAVSLGATNKQLAGTLSGGNKRKLSLAIALIGEPPVLLLDEPSSGMDPGARRWVTMEHFILSPLGMSILQALYTVTFP